MKEGASLGQVDGEVEALDELCVLDTCHQKLGHLHLKEFARKLAQLLNVDLKLNAQNGRGVRANLKNCWQAEEGHAIKDDKLTHLK